ncbi:unnamed protein product [Amaranthus hypochondriacus]
MKSKLPTSTKIFSASKVPKKQRSVRKGCSEFVSVPLLGVKRSNNRVNGSESIRNDFLKKSKHSGWSDHSSKRYVSEALSKEEKEVAEALFALKGITLDRDNKTNNESLEPISLDLLKKVNINLTISSQEARTLKEESDATNSTPTTDQALSADPARPIWSKLSERRQLIPNLKVSVPPVPFQFPPLLRACDDRQRTDSTLLCGSTDQNSDSGIGETKPEKSELKESHINIRLSDSANCQNKEHSTSTECGDIAALPSKPLHGSGVGFPVQSSATLVPSWLNNNSLSCPGSYDDITFSGKVPCSINGGRKSWKRCVAHVYISHLIQVLKTSEGKDLNGTPTAGHMFGSASSMSKTANDVPMLHEKRIAKEDGPSVSGFHDSKKQSFDFLSLSTGAAPEVNNGVDRLGISMEPKGHVPQLNSVAQHNAYMPSLMSLNHFPSIPYKDQGAAVSIALPLVPPQGHLRVPPYLNNPCGSTHMGTARTTQQPLSKHQQQQQQQQQQILTTKIAAQFWHNSIRDQHSMNHKQAHLPAPLPSLESIGSKYFHISEQQLQLQLQLQQLQLQQQQQQQLFGRYPPLPRSGGKLQNTQPT